MVVFSPPGSDIYDEIPDEARSRGELSAEAWLDSTVQLLPYEKKEEALVIYFGSQ